MSTVFEQQVKRLYMLNRYRIGVAAQANRVNAAYHVAGSRSPANSPSPQQIAMEVLSRGRPFNPMPVSHNTGAPKKKDDPFSWGHFFSLSPAKTLLDYASRPLTAIAGYASEAGKDIDAAQARGDNVVESLLAPLKSTRGLKGAAKGFTQPHQKEFIQALQEGHPNASPWATIPAGFALDVALDPLNAVPGAINKGRAAYKAVQAARAPKVAAPVAASFAKTLSPFQPGNIPDLSGMGSAETFTTKLGLGEIAGKLPNVQRLANPNLPDVPAPFRVTQETQMVDTPREVLDIVPGKATEEFKPPNPKLALPRAIKAAIMQDPEYKIGNFRMGDLLRAAENTDRAKDIERLINGHVKGLVASREFKGLPKTVKFTGRSGEGAPFGLSINDAVKLFGTGKIADKLTRYGDDTDKFTQAFPIHDPDDLKNVFLTNVQGQRVSLAEYMTGLGIKPHGVSPSGSEKAIDFKFNFEDTPNIVKKTVMEKAPKVVQVSQRFNNAEMMEWAANNGHHFTPQELKYVTASDSAEQFSTRLTELRTKLVAGNFKTLDEVIQAVEGGLIPQEQVDELLKIAGVKDLKQLKEKATRVLKRTGEIKKPRTISEDITPADTFVQPAENLIAKAAVDGVEQITKGKPVITEQVVRDLAEVLPMSVVDNLVDPQDLSKYPFITDIKKAKRTSSTPGSGRARNLHGWNQYSQADVFRHLTQKASKRHTPVKGKYSPAEYRTLYRVRSEAMYNDVMDGMRLAELALKREGVKFISGSGNTGLLISMTDVLESLEKGFVKRYLFSPPRGKGVTILPTEFLEIGANVVKAKFGQLQPEIARAQNEVILKASPRINNLSEDKAIAVIKTLMKGIDNAAPVIAQRVHANYAQAALKLGSDAKSMSDPVIEKIVTKYANPDASASDLFGDLISRTDDVAATGRVLNAGPEAAEYARNLVDAELSNVIDPGDFAEAALARQAEKGIAVGVKQQASRADEAIREAEDDLLTEDYFDIRMQAGLARSYQPIISKPSQIGQYLNRGFNPAEGHKTLHYMVHRERNVVHTLAKRHHDLMATLHDKALLGASKDGTVARANLSEAFRMLQRGDEPTDAAVGELMDGISKSVDTLFGTNDKGRGSHLVANGHSARLLNQQMDRVGINIEKYGFKENVPIKDQVDNWKLWDDVDDPLDFLDRLQAAFIRSSTYSIVGRELSDRFGSATRGAGQVAIADKRNMSKLVPFMEPGRFYDKSLTTEIAKLERVMSEAIDNMGNTDHPMLKLYDKVLHAWKASVTILLPSHHMRNVMGDTTLAYLDGITSPTHYSDAIKIMMSFKSKYEGWDGYKALQGMGEINPNLGGKIKVKGLGSLSYPQIYKYAFDQGLLPDYHILEDIDSAVAGAGAKRSITRPFKGKVMGAAGGVSQARDHWGRIAHFVGLLKKSDAKTLEEAIAQAGARVRKWHPDGSDLTTFERKTMRRIIPFYSWMRKAIPLVVEASVLRPGKVMVIPKSSFALAEAMGVDPDSLGNPFLGDQLFPDFMQGGIIGPQFTGGPSDGYVQANPGDPVSEIAGGFFGNDPAREILGSVTPFGRVPVEAATGNYWGIDSKIKDKSDYVDQQIPIGSVVSRLTNRSITGLGEPKSGTEGEPNELAFINLLTGLGLQDVSKPSYKKLAQNDANKRSG